MVHAFVALLPSREIYKSRRRGDNVTLSVRRLMEFRGSIRTLLGINPTPVFSLTLNYTWKSAIAD